ncbi:hypothetical protein BDR06DRAFT_1044275 [Suillus hirtellus]|nr:hypothetical protein BDR06DRAFT_1044275 [Suillus hirtellus]
MTAAAPPGVNWSRRSLNWPTMDSKPETIEDVFTRLEVIVQRSNEFILNGYWCTDQRRCLASQQSMRQYRKSFHDHDPSVHLDAGFQPNARQEPPEWAKEPMSGMIKVHEHLDTLGPQSLNAPMPIAGNTHTLSLPFLESNSECHWVAYRFSLSDGALTTYDSYPMRFFKIFDTAAWQQIAILQAIHLVTAISLPPNNRFLVSVSLNKPARLWNLDANLPAGPPLHHERSLYSAALSPDGKVLVAACRNKNAYAWDVHAILKEVGLEDLSIPDVPTRKPLMTARDMFLNLFSHLEVFPVLCGMRYPFSSWQYPSAPSRSLRVALPPHSYIELQQCPTRSIFSRALLIVEVSAVRDKQAHLMLFLCCTSAQRASADAQPPQHQLQGQAQTRVTSSHTQHHQVQSQGQHQAQASSSQTQPTAPSTFEIPTAPDSHTTALSAASVQPRSLPLRTRFVLFLCCASLPHAGTASLARSSQF